TDESKVAGTVLLSVSAVVTSFRLFVRMRQGRLWLDDAWAALAMMINIGFLVVLWLYLQDYGDIVTFSAGASLTNSPSQNGARSSRISILFTVVRMTFPGSLRRWLVRTAIAFFMTAIILGAQIFWTCEAESGWKSQPRPQCDLGRNVAIAQIITDVLGDTILILAPFHLIYKVRLTKPQKLRLLSIFSASGATTVVSLTHAYYLLSNGGLKEVLAAIVELSISLIVANLSVVVAFLFRISTEESTTPAPLELKSIITFGSQPIRKRAPFDPLSTPTMMVGIETSTIRLDGCSTSPTRAAGKGGQDPEAVSLEMLSKPGPFGDA
ncbi:hypothetical protein BKA82DRAFT_148493, partial [Pisolithus tinctorius]